MAADDVVRGAAKAGSWLSDLLGVSDEALSPAVAKAARRMIKDKFSRISRRDSYDAGDLNVLEATKRVVDSDVPTEALKRIVALSNRNVHNTFGNETMSPKTRQALLRMAETGDNIDYMINPDMASSYKLMNNYRGLSPEAARRIASNVEDTSWQVENGMTGDETDRVYDALVNDLPVFQKRVRMEELMSEFDGNPAAEGLFESFVDDGMSLVDARDAVRALLGGQ
jgi:hypothetical protein